MTTSAADAEGVPLVDARDIKELFGHGLGLILDGGIVAAEPSTVVSLIDDQIEILRQGQGIIEGL